MLLAAAAHSEAASRDEWIEREPASNKLYIACRRDNKTIPRQAAEIFHLLLFVVRQV